MSDTTLVIKFRCLCFFVRDEEKGQVHVITPATCSCHHNGRVDEHEAVLVFPREGGRLGESGNFKRPDEPGKADYVTMEGWSVVLPGNGDPIRPEFRSSVLDLNAVAGKPVDPALVRGPRDSRISSRITLNGGQMTGAVTPGTWKFGGQMLGLARDIVWTVTGLPDGPLELRRSRFEVGQEPNPQGDELVETIQPNARGEFRLEFHHALKGDFGSELKERDPSVAVEHFLAYYGMYDGAAAQPLPEFVHSQDIGTIGCIIGGGTVGL